MKVSTRICDFFLLLVLSGCAGGTNAGVGSSRSHGDVVEFAFGDIDGGVVSSMTTRGRVTVLLFVTTFDVSSQAQARRLEDLYRTHVPRLNATAVVLEAPRYVDLARTFRDVLDLHYPVTMVDQHAQSEHPILAKVKMVPTWLILDAAGRLSFVTTGALSPTQLDEAVQSAE